MGSWLETHLKEFVKPVLGFIPSPLAAPSVIFTPQEMSVVKNMWRSVKQASNGKPVLLAGRDVFIFEVLARRENFPTVFRPDISRLTVEHVKEDYSQYFLFDTGFVGSIPRLLRSGSFTMASSNEQSSPRLPLIEDNRQVFPRMRGSRSLALKIEGTPKYWKRAYYREHLYTTEFRYNPTTGFSEEFHVPCKEGTSIGINQELNCGNSGEKDEFHRAAILTIQIFKDSSPKFSTSSMIGYTHGSY